MRRVLALVLLVLAMSLGSGCSSEAAPLDHLVIAAGVPGDVYRTLALGIADAARARWSIETEVVPTAGSTANLRLVAEGSADVGLATADAALDAIDGEDPFDEPLPIVALAGLYDDYLHVVVRADSPIQTIADLAGRRLGTGPEQSVSAIMTARLLAGTVPGVSRVPLATAGTLANALVAGSIDAFALTGGLPMPTVDELARRVPIRLISVGPARSELQKRFPDQYLARSIPAGMYGLASEVDTVGVRNVLVVRKDLPEGVAHAITELLFAANAGLNQRSALATYPLPLHPGASRYYREAKSLV